MPGVVGELLSALFLVHILAQILNFQERFPENKRPVDRALLCVYTKWVYAYDGCLETGATFRHSSFAPSYDSLDPTHIGYSLYPITGLH